MFINQQRTKEYLMRVLEGKCTGMSDHAVISTYGGNSSSGMNEQIERISEAFGVDVGVLIKNPNQLYDYFQVLSSILLTQHNNTLHPHLPARIFRLISLMAFTHPILIKPAQYFISTHLTTLPLTTKPNLETLNILSLIPTFSYSTLNLQNHDFRENSYEKALWLNAVNTLTYSEFYQEWKTKVAEVDQENVCRVRDFVNCVYQINEIVKKQVYEEYFDSVNCTKDNVIKVEDVDITYRNTPQPQRKQHFTHLDIFLSFNNFITLQYLPSNFLQPSYFIQIWIDRTVQVNSLMGNFICKQKLGQFQYVKGPLLYAIEKGIVLILNNFEQISHELLVTMRTLATRHEINHNQRTVHARSGFKIIGVCSEESRRKSKSLQNSASVVPHFHQPAKTIEHLINFNWITNQANRLFITQTLKRLQPYGLGAQYKLWRRMTRLRKNLMNSDFTNKTQQQITEQLWKGYLTQSFKDQIQLQIQQLTNTLDPTRQIQFTRQYKSLKIGRCVLSLKNLPSQNIVPTQYSLRILERLAICQQPSIDQCPLLISQTGCGKTTLVQYLAEIANKKLYVYNMSSGTDVGDLVGGFKPIDCRVMLKELFYQFVEKFTNEVPGAEKNKQYVNSLIGYYEANKLELLLKSLIQSIPKIKLQLTSNTSEELKQWDELYRKFSNILANLDKIDSNLVFSFMEGNLVTALKNGDWVLVDEINLATNDVLQKIVPLVQGKSILLYEKGDLTHVQRNPGFKIIGCMNPATDSGKKPLPPNLHSKFTSINLSEPSRPEIELMVSTLCPQLNPEEIADIYFEIKKQKTVSLRNLSRAMAYINKNRETYGWQRAMYDGLVLGFGEKDILAKYKNEQLPKEKQGYKMIHGFLMEQGPVKDQKVQIFHLTKTFSQHLKDFLRAIAGTDLPVLLQGPTSTGKTSMIKYVAQLAGHKCIRINNHQHTQIQQYLGNYFPDKQGKLVFRQGPLVTAVRQGHWLILDELNLAKTQILQCLNRLLDDNRQLFIPQQQKHIKPHKNFRIFATQNPSSYSGRKKLSRAFRNRFISLMFGDITVVDTMAILQVRRPLVGDSKQLSTYIKKVLEALLNYRQRQKVFNKDGLITMRDLLKWTGRKFVNKEMFIIEGYGILAQRLRTIEEKQHVFNVLANGAKITPEDIFKYYQKVVETNLSEDKISGSKIYVQMNKSFKRMAALTYLGIESNEAILLVGETGCGKTTLAELLSYVLKRPFYSINCHKHTEASDLLGSLRPASDPNATSKFEFVNGVVIEAMLNGGILLIDEINTAEDSVLERLNEVLQSNTIGVERGTGWQSIKAKEGFCIIATMNPSGDYGKKQLSPALRNRFTQIWVQPITHPSLIVDARSDILTMIQAKLSKAYTPQTNSTIAQKLYQFILHYNTNLTQRYNLCRKRLTMRDIGWVCKFLTQSKKYFTEENWLQAYFWALNILAVEGLKFMMNDQHESVLLKEMMVQLKEYVESQCGDGGKRRQAKELQVIQILKQMDFPLMIKTDLPLELLGLQPDARIFFSAHTDLSDLLGQFQPLQNSFVWKDQQLLKNIRHGGRTALMDLNLAQQQVIEGVNSLFDYRGSIFVVQLNETVTKHPQFKPMVVIKYQGGSQRKGLPNSFLNRFVKVCVERVSVQRKMEYLTAKYEGISQRLKELVERIVYKQERYPIQRVQLLIQTCMKSPIQLKNSLSYLSLQSLEVDQFTLLQHPTQFSFFPYQQSLLSLLPLIKQFNVTSYPQLLNIKKLHTIYQLSTFSCCLVGSCLQRDQAVEILSYLLKKKTVKIILSTMTDMNDLLGSYEQVAEGDSSMKEERSLQKAFEGKEQDGKEGQGKKTKFVYMESAIVRALKDQGVLLYIEVPNQTLLQRVEKGLVEVYEQRRQIVIGIDTIRQTTSNITKFIPVILTQHPTPSTPTPSTAIFTQNKSLLTHLDSQLRKTQLQQLLQEQISTQSQRPKILAYKKMMVENQQDAINSIQSRDLLQVKEKKVRQRKIKDLSFTYDSTKDDSVYLKMRSNILGHVPNSYPKHRLYSLMKAFMSLTQDQINKRVTTYSTRLTQPLTQTILKFQTLYNCNINSFQAFSLKVLSVIFSSTITQQQSQQLLQKFASQIDRLYEELFRDKITEVMIRFNQEETRVVPVLDSEVVVRYLMREKGLGVRVMSGVNTRESMLVSNVVERSVLEGIEVMRVEYQEVSDWVYGMRLKDLLAYQMLEEKIKNKVTLMPQYQHLIQLSRQLLQSILPQTDYLELSAHNPSHSLLTLFKPSTSLSQNISLHIKSQLQYQTIKQVISQDQTYLQCYKQLCQIKYLSLQTNKSKLLTKQIQSYQHRLSQLAKSLVYRGHDNVKSLIEFYGYFINQHCIIEQSQYAPQTIRTFLLQSYSSFYDMFSDILLPYYLAVMIVYVQKSKVDHQKSLTVKMLQDARTLGDEGQQTSSQVIQLLEEVIEADENEENDRAKDYIKYQRKFNKTVIVDQYTQEGVEKNKANVEEEFNELFGKNLTQTQHQGPMSDMDRLYYTLNKSTLTYYNLLCQKLSSTPDYQHLIITASLLTTNLPLNNIYEQRNTHCIKQLLQPLPKMLKQVNILLNKYKIDSLKQLGGLFGKIYEHKVFKDEVYKVLVDCQLIIEKAFELNAILPAVERVPTDQLVKECLKMRRLELKNWKSMLGYKQMRTQKADLINMVQFYKTLKLTQTHKQVFAVSQNFLRQSPISCLPSRLTFLDLLAKSLYHSQPLAQCSIYRVIGFYQYLTPHVNQYYLNSYNGKIQQMKEYEKLAGWSSNEYLIFKATCEKFQRKIHHILRRFDDELMMTVGVLVQQVKMKELAGSIEEFGGRVRRDLGLEVQGEEEEGEGDNDKEGDNREGDNKDDKQAKQQKQNSKKPKKLTKTSKQKQPQQQPSQPPTPPNQYQQLITQLFTCLTQLSHSYQNSQSKLRLIRVNLQQLQELIKQKKQSLESTQKLTSHSHQSKFLTEKMFDSQEGYQKTCKYYYGLWDRLCQRHETAWNREIVERVWGVAEAIWLMVNGMIPEPEMPQKEDQLLEDIKVLYRPYLVQGNDKDGTKLNNYMDNAIFRQQLQTIKAYILQSILDKQQPQPHPTCTIPATTTSLTKLGYLLSSIALNLQKNGLCVKQSQQQNQGSGTQQVGDGMGIGQGQVHQAAQNIGDQIQFEQQLQGNKDQEKVEQQHQGKNKQEENDIQMQGDFEGEMHDKEKKQGEDNEEGQQAQQISNQQMGQVDDQKRQQDVKNQQGQAQGKSQADMDIQGQQQGQQQLVDNQRQQQKEQRKGQEKRQNQDGQQEQQQRSDWQDNNEQGDKINKQKQNVEENQREEKDMQDEKPPEEISDEQADDGQDQQEKQGQQDEEMDVEEDDDQDIGQSNQVSQGQQKQQIQIENDQTPMQEEKGEEAPEQQEKQKKQAKNRKQYQRTYGRQDNKKQNNNLVHQQQNQQNPQQNMGEGQENAQGQESQGQRGAGKSVHSLREEFLEEIMRKENQAKGNEEFQKNLDVRIQEENDQDVDEDGQEQQYALTQEDRNKATNLGMMDLEQKHKDEQQKKKQEQNDRQRNKNQQQQSKPSQKQAPTPKNEKKKPSNKNSKNDQLIPKQQQVQQTKTQSKVQKQQHQSEEHQTKTQPLKSQKKKPTTILIDQHQEHLIKAAVSSLTNNQKSAIPKSFAEHPHLISQSFLLSKILQEQLKSVLQPLDQAQYKGDYKTGKKLNLKKIIPFIASNYRKDRIWLRRTQPSQRNYHIMLALDDTKSMHYGDVGEQALKGLLAISMALSHLNINTCVTSIKDNMQVVKSFTDQLNCEKILQQFTFSYESSNSHDLSMSSFMSSSLKQFQKMQSSDSSAQSRQLCIIISDGKMNKQMVKPFLKQATKKGITYVFIIIDSEKNSILNIKTVEYVNGKMEIKLYMTDFPFDFFLVINNAKELGDVLGATLMQFIQEK